MTTTEKSTPGGHASRHGGDGGAPERTEPAVAPAIGSRRVGWIELLGALALVRVVAFHQFDASWLAIAFPSMGILFALGGRSAAASLDRVATPRTFYIARLRRLLPPLWVFGLVVVPLMVVQGWDNHAGGDGSPFDPAQLWTWAFPLAIPPSSPAGYHWVEPLRYLMTYLWLVLMSPALLWLFRRWPLRVAAVPVGLMVLLTSGLLNVDSGNTYDILSHLGVFGCCWLVGFADHDGRLRRFPVVRTLALGVALVAAGLWFAFTHQAEYGSFNPDDIPMADMLYSLGAVLVLLRFRPSVHGVYAVPGAAAVIRLLNERALTIFLWNPFLLGVVPVLLVRTHLDRFDVGGVRGGLLQFAAAWCLVLGAVLLVGGVEDVAAARRPRVLPLRDRRRRAESPTSGGAPGGRFRFEGNEVATDGAVVGGTGLSSHGSGSGRHHAPDHDDRAGTPAGDRSWPLPELGPVHLILSDGSPGRHRAPDLPASPTSAGSQVPT